MALAIESAIHGIARTSVYMPCHGGAVSCHAFAVLLCYWLRRDYERIGDGKCVCVCQYMLWGGATHGLLSAFRHPPPKLSNPQTITDASSSRQPQHLAFTLTRYGRLGQMKSASLGQYVFLEAPYVVCAGSCTASPMRRGQSFPGGASPRAEVRYSYMENGCFRGINTVLESSVCGLPTSW